MRYLLDTNIISEPLKPAPDANIINLLSTVGHQCAIASIVWHELDFGCQRLAEGKRRDTIRKYLDNVLRKNIVILPYDERAAAWHAGERARLARKGLTPPFADSQIAAIAAVNNLILVTVNVSDFHHFNGLKVENWRGLA